MTAPARAPQIEAVADELTTQLLIEIRDATRATNDRLEETNQRLDETNQRLDETNQRLAVLATLTKSIDTRVEKLEAREPDRLFLPRRVERLEEDRDDL